MTCCSRASLPRGVGLAAALALSLAACGAPPRPTGITANVPPFARVPYEPFGRTEAVAIAVREWRAFGSRVEDPNPGPRAGGEAKPERLPGLWERIGEYWWIGQDAARPEAAWTGKHDANGVVFPPREDADFAWSAAFISYVMRTAGAGGRFPYSPSHATYINAAVRMAHGEARGWAVVAERADAYAPQPGDLICTGRDGAAGMRLEQLPSARSFPAHCDIVVEAGGGGPTLGVIGGNVSDAVTLSRVPVTPGGLLAPPGGQALDPAHEWFAVLRVLYDR